MKTVKEYISELNTDELVMTYFQKYSRKLAYYYYAIDQDDEDDEDESDEELSTLLKETSVFDYAEGALFELHDYVEYLKTIAITPPEDGSQGIIYAFNVLDDDCRRQIQTELLIKDKLLEDMEGCSHYSYYYTPFSEILGFLVADNELTQKSIYEVIADVLYWASVTGYRQEDLEESIRSLKEAEEKIDNGEYETFDSLDDLMEDLFGKDQDEERYEEDGESKRLCREVEKAMSRYVEYSINKERKLIVESLKGEG